MIVTWLKKKEEIVNNPIESKETISSETLYEKIQIEEVVKNKEEFKVDAPNYTVDNKDEKTDAVVEEVSPETTKKTKKTKSEDSKENEAQIIKCKSSIEIQKLLDDLVDSFDKDVCVDIKNVRKNRKKEVKKKTL